LSTGAVGIGSITNVETAINGKQGAITLTTTGTSGAATLIGDVLNIPQYSGGAGGAEWGGITGTLSDQADLQSALDAKQNSLGFTPENVANKSTDVNTDQASNTKYPSVKAVYDWVVGLFVQKNAAITGATKTKITYDAKGLVTAGADIEATDLPSGIDATKIADGSVTNAEFQYLGSVTSDIQTQLNGKQATITGAATTIDTENLTASRALVSDGSGKVAVSSVTSTELGYVSGVTSAVQTQVDSKTAKLITTNRQTASYTLVLSDADKLVEMNVGSANNLTVPASVFSAGQQILLAQYGAGQTTIVAGSGMTIRSNGGKLKLNVQYSGATLIFLSSSEAYLFGDIVS
jgi:hypothetical protein